MEPAGSVVKGRFICALCVRCFLYFVWKKASINCFPFYIIKNVSARQKWYYSPLDLVTSDAPVNTDCQDFLSEFLATLLIFSVL